MDDKPDKTSKNEPTFAGEIGAKAARKLKARKSAQGVWFGLGMMGLVGWSVVVPTLRHLPILETRAEHFLRALEAGKVSTNVYLRRIPVILPWT